MSSGLAALLDDVAAIAKLAAASLDDVGAAAGKASAKAAGVVVDDTAVTPNYVTGLAPERELPMIWRISLGSLRNKLFILLPVAIGLSLFAPWAITPLLMIGGAFLCFEGTEKLIESAHGDEPCEEEEVIGDPAHIEAQRVGGAIRTDLILSAEIMAIALADLAATPVLIQAAALVIVSFAVTAGVYGLVGFIVKMDDIGLYLARRGKGLVERFGRMMVRAMPSLLSALSSIGMVAMLWVGGGIIVHGLERFQVPVVPGVIHHAADAAAHALPAIGGFAGWLVSAALSAVTGFVVGAIVTFVVHRVQKFRGAGH
jgi:predicted DNA repair protein MutK